MKKHSHSMEQTVMDFQTRHSEIYKDGDNLTQRIEFIIIVHNLLPTTSSHGEN